MPGQVHLAGVFLLSVLCSPDGENVSVSLPNTGQNVQGWSADEVTTDDNNSYQSFQCIACTRVHLVDLKTGKVLGEEDR